MVFLEIINIICSLVIFSSAIILPNHNTEIMFLIFLISILFEFAIYLLFSTRRSKKYKERLTKGKIENVTSGVLLLGSIATIIAVNLIPYKLDWLDQYVPIIISLLLIFFNWFYIMMFIFAEISIAKTQVKEGYNKLRKITFYRFIVFLWITIPFIILGYIVLFKGGIVSGNMV